MRLPARRINRMRADTDESIRIFRHGVDLDVNYVDTAWPYHLGDSEPEKVDAILGMRGKISDHFPGAWGRSSSMEWPSLLILLVLVLLTSVLWTNRFGAPWVPTPMRTVRKMLEMAGVGPGDLVYDLGCGDGRTIITAARRYGARAVGIEIDPFRYLWCQLLITVLGLRGQVRVLYGSFYRQDLSEASVVTCYLLQSTNEKLQGKLMRELRPDTRIVSHSFTFPRLHLLRQDGGDELYLYNLSA
jgi:SAM-dependent methyltransferase